MTMLWQQVTQGCARLECLALTAPSWGRAILYREIKTLDHFSLHIIEPIEADGIPLPSFCRARLASILADLRPLAALVRQSEANDWEHTINTLQEVNHA